MSFVDNIEYMGGYGYCNALEAIAVAMNNERQWSELPEDVRISERKIFVCSNSKIRPFGGYQVDVKTYPPDMPDSLERLFERAREGCWMVIYFPKVEDLSWDLYDFLDHESYWQTGVVDEDYIGIREILKRKIK